MTTIFISQLKTLSRIIINKNGKIELWGILLFLATSQLIVVMAPQTGWSQQKDHKLDVSTVKADTRKAWRAYEKYAWGHDLLKPVSETPEDWYKHSLGLTPIDAFSTLHMMGMKRETKQVVSFITDSLDFEKDIFVKFFEINIRAMGGLLNVYRVTKNPEVLAKAKDLGQRLLPAFDSPTGLPYYWVNLKTGEVKGDTVSVAEAGTCLLEMGILSYYTKNPIYYQKAKEAARAIFKRRTKLNLYGQDMDITAGKWVDHKAHIGAGVDSFYEYLYKGWLLFGDKDLKRMWDTSIAAIHNYNQRRLDNRFWYGTVHHKTGNLISDEVTLWDAFFPALLMLEGDRQRASDLMYTWNRLWNRYGLVPAVYNMKKQKIVNPSYLLNPEIIESAFYLHHYTDKKIYREMVRTYYRDLRKYCRLENGAFTTIRDVKTKKKGDAMPTYFLAETLKYIYLTLGNGRHINPENYVFTTEAHPFKISAFDSSRVRKRLGLSQ